ncbi:MAG: hypothetical protein IPK78_20025 [Rhodospirillales bacterium]|nr:hypothetical protein [Rhodospirillales bacterium]
MHVQFSPDVNPRAPWRAPYRFTPQPGQTITFGTFTYTWDENLNLVRASTTDISLGARDPVMYAGVPGMQAGEDYGHLLGADFGNIDAVIGRYGGFRQASSVNRPLGVAPALWYNAERIALATALQLKQSAQPFRVVAEARGFVNGVPAETRIFVESSNAIVYDSGWIANPIVP